MSDDNNDGYTERTTGKITSNRERIYQYINYNPGVHLRRISKELNLAIGDTLYNINKLEESGLIKHRKWNMYKRYFIISISNNRSQVILALLQQETTREIILFLIENPGSTQIEISKRISFSAPTVKWHMSRLIEMDIVYSHKESKFIKYFLKGDVNDIISLMKIYHPSIWSKLANRLAEIFIELSAISNLYDSSNQNKILEDEGDVPSNNLNEKGDANETDF